VGLRVLLLLSLVAGGPAARAEPAAIDLIRRAIAVAPANDELIRSYTFIERSETRHLDGDGRVSSTKIETHDVTLVDGSPHRRLIARDDQPLSPEEARKEEEKLRKSIEQIRNETLEERAKRLEEVDRRAEPRRRIRQELEFSHSYRIVGEQRLRGRDAWIVEAAPREDYEPKDRRSGFLKKMRGRIWIDKATFGPLRLEAESIDIASVGWFLFRLHEGARIEIDQRYVNDEVWLPERFYLRFQGRIALIKGVHREVRSTYRDYRKFTAESRVVGSQPVE
jgi:hypothetical protein